MKNSVSKINSLSSSFLVIIFSFILCFLVSGSEAAVANLGCTSLGDSQVVGGTYTAITINAATCQYPITIQNVVLTGQMTITVDSFRDRFTMKDSVISGSTSGWGISFASKTISSTFVIDFQNDVAFSNITLSTSASIQTLIYFSNPASMLGTANMFSVAKSTLNFADSNKLKATIFHFSKDVDFNKLFINDNVVNALVTNSSSFIYFETYVSTSSFDPRTDGLTLSPENGVVISNNVVNFTSSENALYGNFIMTLVGSRWNATSLVVRSNSVYMTSKYGGTSNLQNLVGFDQVGPSFVPANPRFHLVVVRDNNFTIAQTSTEFAAVYFFNAVQAKIFFNVSVYDNQFDIRSGIGGELVNFNTNPAPMYVYIARNKLTVETTKERSSTTAPYIFLFWAGGASTNVEVKLLDNTVNAKIRYGGKLEALRISSVLDSHKLAISGNTFDVDSVDNSLRRFVLFSFGLASNCSIANHYNDISVHFSNETSTALTTPNLGIIPFVTTLWGKVQHPTSGANLPSTSASVKNNKITVDGDSDYIRTLAKFPVSLNVVFFTFDSNNVVTTVEGNVAKMLMRGNATVAYLENVKNAKSLTVQNNSVTCGFSVINTYYAGLEGTFNATVCTANSLLHVMEGNIAFPTSAYRVTSAVLRDNSVTSMCYNPTANTELSYPDSGFTPPHTLFLSTNSSVDSLTISNNIVEHDFCSGFQLARFVPNINDSNIENYINLDMSSNPVSTIRVGNTVSYLSITNNNISTSRCFPSCDLLAFQPSLNFMKLIKKPANIIVAADYNELDFTVQSNTIKLYKESTIYDGFVSFLNLCLYSVDGNATKTSRNCTNGIDFLNTNTNNINNRPTLNIMFPNAGGSSFNLNFETNVLDCAEGWSGGSGGTTTSTMAPSDRRAAALGAPANYGLPRVLLDTCNFSDTSALISTILIRSSSSSSLGSGTTLRLIKNTVATRFQNVNENGIATPMVQIIGAPNLNVTHASVVVNCNKWSREFQRNTTGDRYSTGILCAGAADCDNVDACFTKTVSQTPIPPPESCSSSGSVTQLRLSWNSTVLSLISPSEFTANQRKILAAPVNLNGSVIIGNAGGVIACLNETTGQLIWNYTITNSSGEAGAETVRSDFVIVKDPVVNKKLGHVYFVSNETSEIYCFRIKDGAVVGTLRRRTTARYFDFTLTLSEILGILYFGTDEGIYFAYNASSLSKQIWNYTVCVTPASCSFPAGAAVDESQNAVFFGNSQGTVYALHATLGSLYWSKSGTGQSVVASPVIVWKNKSLKSVVFGFIAQNGQCVIAAFKDTNGASGGNSLDWCVQVTGATLEVAGKLSASYINSGSFDASNRVYYTVKNDKMFSVHASTGGPVFNFAPVSSANAQFVVPPLFYIPSLDNSTGSTNTTAGVIFGAASNDASSGVIFARSANDGSYLNQVSGGPTSFTAAGLVSQNGYIIFGADQGQVLAFSGLCPPGDAPTETTTSTTTTSTTTSSTTTSSTTTSTTTSTTSTTSSTTSSTTTSTSSTTTATSTSTTSTTSTLPSTTSSTTTSTTTSSTTSSTTGASSSITSSTTTTTAVPQATKTDRKNRTRTKTFTLVPHVTTLAPRPVPPIVAQVSTSTTAATSLSAAFMMEPSAPMVASRTLGLSVIAGECESGTVSQGTKDLQLRSEPMQFPQSLLPFLYVGDRAVEGWRPYLRGSIIANVLVAPLVVTLIGVGVAALAEYIQFQADKKRALKGGRMAVKRKTDLYAKAKVAAVFGIVIGTGIEGASFSIVALLTSRTAVQNPPIAYEDDIVISTFAGIIPLALFFWFIMHQLRGVLKFSSCDPAVLRKGRRAELDMKEAYPNHPRVVKFFQLLFGSECWVRDSDEQIGAQIEEEKQIDIKKEQQITLDAENSRLSSIPRSMRRVTSEPKEFIQQNLSDDASSASREIKETLIYISKMQPRMSSLFARFKGISKNADKMLLASDDFNEFTSLSAVAAASLKAKQTPMAAAISRFARRVAPYTFVIECLLNIAMGVVRGLVTTEILPCSVARVLVAAIVVAAFLYSCVVLPRISSVSTFVDIVVNGLVCLSGIMVLLGSASTASIASTAVAVLAVLSLSVSASRIYFVVIRKIQLFPLNEKGGVDIPGDTSNGMLVGGGDGSSFPDGGGPNRNQRAASTMGGVGATDGPSGMFLIENLISAFGGGDDDDNNNNNNDDDDEEQQRHNEYLRNNSNKNRVEYALGGAQQEMKTINPNLSNNNNNTSKPSNSAPPTQNQAANDNDDEIEIDLEDILSSDQTRNNNDDVDLFNLNLDDDDDDAEAESNNLNQTLGARKNEELERRQRELEAFLGVNIEEDEFAQI